MLFFRTWHKSHCSLTGLVVCCVVQAFGNSTVNFNSKAYWFFSFTYIIYSIYSCFSNKSVHILAGKNIIVKSSRNRGKRYIVSCDWLLFKTLNEQRALRQSIFFIKENSTSTRFLYSFLSEQTLLSFKHVSQV